MFVSIACAALLALPVRAQAQNQDQVMYAVDYMLHQGVLGVVVVVQAFAIVHLYRKIDVFLERFIEVSTSKSRMVERLAAIEERNQEIIKNYEKQGK